MESNEQNKHKENRNRLIDRETNCPLSEGSGLGDWVKKVKGLSKEQKPQRHRQQYSDYQKEWWGVGEKGKWGINGDGRRFGLGWWAHNTIYRWCIIELYTWTLYNFINQHHSNKFNKFFKEQLI